MKVLAIDFSSSRRSVALVELDDRGSTLLAERNEQGTRETHAFRMIETVIDHADATRHDIDALAIGLGPGSYGGIRVALSIAQGWQIATGIQTAGVSSAATIAESARASGCRGTLNVVTDAQRSEFYLACFELNECSATLTQDLEIVSRVALEQSIASGTVHVGPDLDARVDGITCVYPSAAAQAKLAYAEQDFVPAATLAPVYIRPVAFVKAPKVRTDL